MSSRNWEEMRAEEEKTFIDIPFSWNEKSSFEEVQSYLNFLEKIDGTEKYYRSYYECLRKRHIISSTLSNLQSEDKEKIGLHWLRICYATDDKRANFFFLTHPDPSLDREEEIRKILFPPNGKGNLDNFFSEKPEGKAYLQPLLEWFRHRYDLDTANRIQKHINKIQRNLERPDQSSFGFSVAALVLISFFTVLFVILYYASGSTPWTPEIWDVSFGPPLSQVWIIPFLWGSVLLLYLGSIFVAWRKRHLIIPKLIGGISAGYLFLLSSDSLINFTLHSRFFNTVLIDLGSLLVCFLFLHTEVRRRTHPSRVKIWKRVINLFSIALVESLVLGFLITELYWKSLYQHIQANPPDSMPIYFLGPLGGALCPKVLALFIPLALLVGIVLQLFWEEKPISQL